MGPSVQVLRLSPGVLYARHQAGDGHCPQKQLERIFFSLQRAGLLWMKRGIGETLFQDEVAKTVGARQGGQARRSGADGGWINKQKWNLSEAVSVGLFLQSLILAPSVFVG